MCPVSVAPISDIAISPDRLKDNFLFRLAQGHDQQYFVALGEIKGLLELLAIYSAQHATAEALFCGAQQDGLRGNPMIAAVGRGNLSIACDNNVCCGPLTFTRSGPLFEISRPGEAGKYGRVHFGVAGDDIFQGLPVGPRCRQPRALGH